MSKASGMHASSATELFHRHAARTGAAARRAEQYLRSRQSPDGGFCFYRWGGVEESSLADTWHAVAAFKLLGVEVPRRDAVIKFVRGFHTGGLDDVYHQAMTFDALGLGIASDHQLRDRARAFDAMAAIANDRVPVSARLARTLQIVTLQQRCATLDEPEVIASRVNALRDDGGWGDKANLEDTWLALAVLAACGADSSTGDTRSFVNALQVASFGFTATRDSAYATLDVVHAGVRACRTLGVPVRRADDVLDFILACQSDAGGFARTADALPNLALTHRGLLALAAAGALSASSSSGWHGDSGC